jgi:hypothetical protein
MKTLKFSWLFVALMCILNVHARQPSASSELAQAKAEAQSEFDRYLANKSMVSKDSLNIGKIQRNLPKTRSNIQSLRSLLASKISDDDKINTLRILGEMYDNANEHGENANIVHDIKSNIAHSNHSFAAAALYAYTRKIHDSEYFSIMRQARSRGILGDNEYYGEHAHVFRFMPKEAQNEILSELSVSANEYALQIFASDLSNTENVRHLPREIADSALKLLTANEPRFPMAIGDFGGFHNYYYENWIRSVALLSGAVSDVQFREFVNKQLSRSDQDPRKILALLSSQMGKDLMRQPLKIQQAELIVTRMCGYVNSFPTSSNIQGPARQAEAAISSSRPEFKGMSCSKYDG